MTWPTTCSPGEPYLMKFLDTASMAHPVGLPCGGCVKIGPAGEAAKLLHVTWPAAHELSVKPSSSIGIFSVRSALRLFSVSFNTAAVAFAGFVTVNFMAPAWVMLWADGWVPTHICAELLKLVADRLPALTCTAAVATRLVADVAAAGTVTRTRLSGARVCKQARTAQHGPAHR